MNRMQLQLHWMFEWFCFCVSDYLSFSVINNVWYVFAGSLSNVIIWLKFCLFSDKLSNQSNIELNNVVNSVGKCLHIWSQKHVSNNYCQNRWHLYWLFLLIELIFVKLVSMSTQFQYHILNWTNWNISYANTNENWIFSKMHQFGLRLNYRPIE